MIHRNHILYLLAILGLLLLAGCDPAAASSDSPALGTPEFPNGTGFPTGCPPAAGSQAPCGPATLTATSTIIPMQTTVAPTPVLQTSPTPSATPLPPTPTACPPDLCSFSFPYFLQRPIAPPGNDVVDATYRFGTTQGGRREPHHGVEFLNPYGIPVLAAGEGIVVFAAQDTEPLSPEGVWPPVFYGPFSNFYGNVVMIEHQVPAAMRQVFPDMPLPVYSVYAHLSEISVEAGQQVQAGQEIGKVGMTGIAEGSHLHFEVRLGENLYANVRNPELWLAPHEIIGAAGSGQLNGGIAGSIVDSQGNLIILENSLVLVHLPQGPDQPGGREIYLQDYEESDLLGQPPFADSFAVGDIPPGWYRITFPHNGLQQYLVEVFPGQLSWVRIRVE